MHRNFSTGSPDFDRYLGGIRKGDSFLILQASHGESQPILRMCMDHLRRQDLPLTYLKLSGSRDFLLTGIRSRTLTPPERARNSGIALRRWLSGIRRHIRAGEVVLLDDLSSWGEGPGGFRQIVKDFDALARTVQQRKAFLLATALRRAFDPSSLASLKETSSICIELSSLGGDLLAIPLNLRDRYIAGPAAPFGFRAAGRGTGKKRRFIPIQDLQSPHGEKIRAAATGHEEIAGEILEGPFKDSPFGMLIADLEGSFTAVNDRLRKMVGVPGAGEQLPPVSSFIPAGRRWPFLRFLAEIRKSRAGSSDLRVRTSEGKEIPVRVRAMTVGAGLTLFLIDDNRAGEEAGRTIVELQRAVGSLFGDNPVPLCFADRKKIYATNEAFLRLRGGTDSPGREYSLPSCFSGKTLRQLREEIDGVLSGTARASFSGQLLRTDGSAITVRIGVTPAGAGREGQCALTVEDVSEFSSRIAALEESDRRFRTITEQVSLPVALLRDGVVTYGNNRFLALLGLGSDQELRGRPLAELVSAAERDEFTATLSKFAASRQPVQQLDATIVGADGLELGVRVTLRKVQGLADAGILVEFEDVTDRRKEERRLAGMQEGTERIKSILEAATGTLEYDRLVHIALDRSLEVLGWSGGVVFMLDAAAKAFRAVYSRHMPKKLLETFDVLPSAEGLGGFVSKTMESHVVSLEKYPSFLPYRTLFREHRVRQMSLVPLVHGEAPIGFILGISTAGGKADPVSVETLSTLGRQLGNALVNARKLAAVRESEQRLHTVVDSLSGIVYTAGPDGTILTIDAAVGGILGYTPREFDRNRSLFLSLIHEEDKKIYLERVTGSTTLGPGFVREYRMRPKAKASFRWMRDSVSVMRDQEGAVAGFTGILADVTEDRERMQAVMTEQTILRTVQDALPDGIAVFDDGAVCVDWNPTMELITGLTRAAAAGRSAKGLAPLPESLGSDGFDLALASRKPIRLGLVESAGCPGTWYESFLVPVPGRGDAGPGFLLRYADVTARRAEVEHLLQSEKILLNVINAMDDVMMITDLAGRVVEVNQAFLKVMRYPRSQVVGQEFPYPWLVDRDMGRFMVWISRIREQQWLHDFDVTWVALGGTEVQMSLNTTLIRNSMGEPVAMLNIARDISDRVRLTHDVEARNNQIEMINRIITLANRSNDFAEIFRTVVDEVVRLMPAHAIFTVFPDGPGCPFCQSVSLDGEPLTDGEILAFATTVRDAGLPPDGVIADLREFPGGAGSAGRFRSAVVVPIGGGGSPAPLMAVASREPHAYGEEHPAILRPLAAQLGGIIERLRLFRQVLSDSTYVGNLLDSIDSPVYTVDGDFTVTRINRAGIGFLREVCGGAPASFVGANLLGLLPDSALKDAIREAFRSPGTDPGPRYTKEIAIGGPGPARTTRLTVNPLQEDGATNGFVLSHTDITALKTTENELRNRANQLITLHEISAVISNTFDIGSILASALSLLRDVLAARGLIVYLADPGDGALELEHQDGFDPASVSDVTTLHPDLSITGDVVRRRTPRYIGSDVAGDTRIAPPNRRFLLTHSIEAMAVVPIVAKEKVLGALDVFYDSPHEFTEQERYVLNLAGNQIGAAIENVHLYAELTAQVERLRVLFELSQKLTSLLDTAEIHRAVFDHVRRVVECERCSISVLNPATGGLSPVMRAVREGDDFRVEHLPPDGGSGPDTDAAAALSDRKTHRAPDGATVVVPMVSEDTVIGVIEIVRGDARPFDDVQVRLLESVGYLTAIAIQKAGLYEETVRTSRQIEQRNRELDDFTYVVSHDLKEPLISIEGFSRILQMDYSDVIRAEGREYLDSLVGATTRMKGLIDDLLMLSRVSRPTESFREVDLGAIVGEIRADMEFVIRKRNVEFRVDPALPRVFGNETQLKILFRNLIGNAVKFNDKAAPFVEVGFRYQENNSYLFWVKDNGIGIEPEFFEKIFVIFQRLHRREEFEGSGAGLAIVKKIMEIHQGKIWVESQKGTGSMFCFTLPASAGI